MHKILSLLLIVFCLQLLADPPSSYEAQWFVIAGGAPKGTTPELHKGFLDNPELEARVIILESENFTNFNPGFSIVVAESFYDQSDAKAYSQKLKKLGIDNYIKFSGAYREYGDDVQIYWVESYGGRVFMKIPIDSSEASRITPRPSSPERITLGAWAQVLPAKSLGSTHIGQKLTAFSLPKEIASTAKITQYVWFTRGEPHFGHLQREMDGEKITEPVCGSPELFAEITCPNGEEMSFAVAGKKYTGTTIYKKSEDVTNAELTSLVKSSEGYLLYLSKATHEAETKKEELKIRHYINHFSGGRDLYVVNMEYYTEYGETECGANDLSIKTIAIYEKTTNGYKVIEKPHETELRIEGITDVNQDGVVEIIEGWFVERVFRIENEGHEPKQKIRVPFCDCGC